MRRLLTPLLVCVLLITAGCSTTGSTTTYADRIQSESTTAMQSVDSYEFDMEMSLIVEDADESLTMSADGVVNRSNRRMQFRASVAGQSVQSYLVNETMYVTVDGETQTQDVSDRNIWEQNDRLARQKELLASADAMSTENVTRDGEAFIKLHIEPDEQQTKELAEEQMGQSFGDVNVEEVEYDVYIAKETKRMTEMDMRMEMSQDGQTVTAEMVMTFSDFGTETNIEPPETE